MQMYLYILYLSSPYTEIRVSSLVEITCFPSDKPFMRLFEKAVRHEYSQEVKTEAEPFTARPETLCIEKFLRNESRMTLAENS